MKLKFVLFPIFAGIIALSAIEHATAQMPRNLTIQGVLTDSTSKPVPDGIHTITLRMYDKLFGGNIVHSEEFTTPVFKGLFNLTIGSKTPISQSVVFDKQYYVGISCDGHSEIARIPFSSVPYSLMAESVPDGSITSSKIADGSITLEKLSPELRIDKKSNTGLANNASGPFAFIGGGDNNVASGSYSSVIGGLSNKAQANFATAAGGNSNTAIALNATVSGGNSNSASAVSSTVGGGGSNSAAATYSTVAGGLQNMSSGNHSAISGGYSNISSGNFSSINGGQSNTASNASASIGGGQSNIVSSQYGSVGGGYSNSIGSSSNGSAIAGGYDNTISANSQYSFIGGGYTNGISSSQYSTVGGGYSNSVSGNYGAILGGKDNLAGGLYSFVGGGQDNTASGGYSVVNGGNGNTASGGSSSINGGINNTVSGDNGAIVGGSNNIVSGAGAIAMGGNISISTSASGAIVIGNGATSSAKLSSSTPNSLSIGFGSSVPTLFVEKAQSASSVGRVGIGNTNPTTLLDVSGALTLRSMSNPGVAGAGQGRIYFDPVSGKFKASQNGSEYVDLIGESGGGGGGWLLTGNSGIVEGTHYIGPTNNVYLELRAGDGCSSCGGESTSITRLRLNTNGSIQRFGDGDARGDNAIDFQDIRDTDEQVASGEFSVISGGVANTASEYGTTVGGGESNVSSSIYSTIAGGNRNLATGMLSFIGGGQDNATDGLFNSIIGGAGNIAEFDASFSSILGGGGNIIGGTEGGATFSTILGGDFNTVTSNYSVILGGTGLRLDGLHSLGFHANHFDGDSGFYNRDMTVGNNNTVLLSNVDLWLANNDNSPRTLRFYEQFDTPGDFPNGTNYVGFKAPNSIDNDVIWTLPDVDGTSGQVLSTDGAGVLSWSAGGSGGGLVHFTESENTTAPNDGGVPAVRLIATGASSDLDVVLSPKGTGGLAAQLADDALNGGEKRGQYAVDWQMQRNNPNMVASGHYSVISGGFNNSARGFAGAVAGGSDNSVGFDVTNSAVLGGSANAVGGIETAGNYSSIVGGRNNEISGDLSVVIGGSGLNLSGHRSFGFNANRDGGVGDDRNMSVSENSTAIFANVDLWLANNDDVPRTLRFYEQYDAAGAFPGTTNFVGFRAPNTVTADVTWTLPNSDGEAGKVLTTDGSGNLSWTGGSIPCGGIIMWTGDINSVPAGWALCDGTNGTPNLNDRFPRGTTSAASVGTTGGNDTHSHTVDDHSHTITGISGSGSGTANFTGSTDNSTTGITANLASGSDVTTSADNSNNTLSSSVDITDNGHSHSVSGSSSDVSVTVNVSGSTDNSVSVGTNQADNVPAFVYVGYIMRVCTP